MTVGAYPLRFDVSDVVGEDASLAATYYPARTEGGSGAVLVCLPGGTYSREYWDLAVPRRSGYSFAEFATGRGYPVVTVDPLGTGESSRPAREFDFADIAAALASAEVARQILAALPDPYFDGARAHLQSWFHLADVPADVIAADSVTAKSVVPRVFGTALVPGVAAEHAARINVPVLLGYGVVDVSPEPRAEAALYPGSPDVTTVVVPGSAHCHNMASSRHRLWRRVLAWVETTVADL